MASAAELQILLKVKDQASGKMSVIGKNAQKMGKTFQKVGLIMAGIGIGIIAGLGKLTLEYAKAGDEVAKMAKRTGLGTEALSELRFVAKITGTELSSVEKGIKKMARSIIDADRGLETYARSFRELGLNIEELRAMKPEEQFFTIGAAIGELEDATLKASLAQEIFGRAGTELLPLFQESKESIQALREEAEKLGIVFREEDAAAAEEFIDATTRLKESMSGLEFAIGRALIPQLIALVDLFTERIKPAIDFLNENPQIIQSFIKFIGIFAATGALAVGVATIIKLFNFLRKAIIGARTAAIFLQGVLLGPLGLVKILAGLAVATGLVVGISKLEQKLSAAGNTAPGVRTDIHGVPITPARLGVPSSITINNNIQGSVITEGELTETIRTNLIDVQNRNTTTGIE